jgi:hypothetical protein
MSPRADGAIAARINAATGTNSFLIFMRWIRLVVDSA